MSWHARLQLDYRLEQDRSVLRFAHQGPLRVLQSLYPEGEAVCHNVLVHPPGGLVGGDVLDLQVQVAEGAHALITTPGATRFYKTDGPRASQRTHLALAPGARLEWLPLEAICYNACDADNEVQLALAPGAELLGWDVVALGLPHAGQPFAQGRFRQHIELPGVWLERGCIDAADTRLLHSPLGLAGQRCLATLFFAAGEPLARPRAALALEAAHACLDPAAPGLHAAVTQPHPQGLVLRVLAPQVEPAMALLRRVWTAWRLVLWQKRACSPRIWSM